MAASSATPNPAMPARGASPPGKENSQPHNAAMMGLRDKMAAQIAAFQKRGGREFSPPPPGGGAPPQGHHQHHHQQQPHRPEPAKEGEGAKELLCERDALRRELDSLSVHARQYKEERARLVFDLDACRARCEALRRDKELAVEALRTRTSQAEEIADALEQCRAERDAALQSVQQGQPRAHDLARALKRCKAELQEALQREGGAIAEAMAQAEIARCERDAAHAKITALRDERDAIALALNELGISSAGAPSPPPSESPRQAAWSLSPASSRGDSESPAAARPREEGLHLVALPVPAPPSNAAVAWLGRHAGQGVGMVLSPVPEERAREGTADSGDALVTPCVYCAFTACRRQLQTRASDVV